MFEQTMSRLGGGVGDAHVQHHPPNSHVEALKAVLPVGGRVGS